MTSQSGAVSDTVVFDCASEPIRVPGAIQPHGYLLAFDAETLVLQHASANAWTLTDAGLDFVLGRPLGEWLDPQTSHALQSAIQGHDEADSDFALLIKGVAFDANAHRMGGLSLVELEPVIGPSVNSELLLARTLRRLQSAVGLPALHEVTVREIRELTGCDRVVIYAFGSDGHGQVLSEAKAADIPSYLGLHFPASDIPAQARELYKLNWLRMIPDVDYEPVPILGLQTVAAGAPLDLSFAMLRSVSPVHREYMRQMGAASSMSISLLRGDHLWGLVSCVHRSPKLLSREVRAACLSIGRLLSLQIAALESIKESQLVDANQALLEPLINQLQLSSGEVFASLSDAPEDLLRLTDATGGAILIGHDLRLVGVCPSEAQVRALADWAAEQALGSGHVATHRLPADYHPAHAFAEHASGLLAITLPKPAPCMLLWFRCEAGRTVTWAGDPDKAGILAPAASTRRLSPRTSFAAWQTLLRNQSGEWAPHQVRAARDLRRVAIELDLARQVVREHRAVASRDELVAVVSHDLRSPLNVVALQASLLVRTLTAEAGASSRRLLIAAQSIQRATTRMSEMLRDLLDLSSIEQGRYSVDLQPHCVEEIFEDSQALLTPLAETRKIDLQFEMELGLVVHADAERLYQVISNLVGNALKFTPEGGSVRVSALADKETDGRLVQFVVTDTGRGMTVEQMGHIFERYWRVRDANPTGSGLGLYITQGIVHAHGGMIWVDSQVGVGSTFNFTLPRTGLALPVSNATMDAR